MTIKVVCSKCKTDDVKICKESSTTVHTYLQCNTEGCDYNEEYVFPLDKNSLLINGETL